MGNCQAIDNATLLIQHPSGRVDKLYWPVTASEIMKMHPGHYVALLLTTTVCPLQNTTSNYSNNSNNSNNNNNNNSSSSNNNNNSSNVPVRITRIKLLRPTDTLGLGHVYRLVTTQEVMKGLKAKKYSKMKQQHPELAQKHQRMTDKIGSTDFEHVATRSVEKNQVIHERHRVKAPPPPLTNQSKSRAWQPALKSISEAGS